jgi:hypothetical protein
MSSKSSAIGKGILIGAAAGAALYVMWRRARERREIYDAPFEAPERAPEPAQEAFVPEAEAEPEPVEAPEPEPEPVADEVTEPVAEEARARERPRHVARRRGGRADATDAASASHGERRRRAATQGRLSPVHADVLRSRAPEGSRMGPLRAT